MSRNGNRQERTETIRFKHIDGARIGFYPRYYEMLAANYPESELAVPPFAMRSEFRRPLHLGDELRLIHQRDPESGQAKFVGKLGDDVCFSFASLPSDGAAVANDAHCPDVSAFRTGSRTIGDWATDRSGRLHLSRYFEMVSDSVEEWFEGAHGVSLAQLLDDRGIGIPTARFTTRCRELPTSGDSVSIWIRVTRVGTKSLQFTNYLVRGDECLVENEHVIVFVKMSRDGFSSVSIPDDIRQNCEEHSNVAA